jgi:putative ABC transport system substrate-binding protein
MTRAAVLEVSKIAVAVVLLGVTLFLSGSVDAQPTSRPRVIGFIGNADVRNSGPQLEAFKQGLRELGWIDGQTARIESRWAEGRPDRLPQLVAELVRLNVDVLVVSGPPAVRAARDATRTIPIVFAAMLIDPVDGGFVQSLARPGGNITGLTSISAELGGKRLEVLKEVVPKATRVGVLFDPDDRANALVLKELQNAAPTLGLTLIPFEVRSPGDFENAFKEMTRRRVHAIFGAAGSVTVTYLGVLVGLASRDRVPALFGSPDFVQAGGLMSYGVSYVDQSRQAATYVDNILKGAKPADLPVAQPITFELVINLKTAKALGLTIPRSLLLRAAQVIE